MSEEPLYPDLEKIDGRLRSRIRNRLMIVCVSGYEMGGTALIRNRQPPWHYHRSVGMVLLLGPTGLRFHGPTVGSYGVARKPCRGGGTGI